MIVIGKDAHTPANFPDRVGPRLDITLDRLQTDYVDLYFLHRDNVDVPVDEWLDVMNAEERAAASAYSEHRTGRWPESRKPTPEPLPMH